jgi:hypothetical protein
MPAREEHIATKIQIPFIAFVITNFANVKEIFGA